MKKKQRTSLVYNEKNKRGEKSLRSDEINRRKEDTTTFFAPFGFCETRQKEFRLYFQRWLIYLPLLLNESWQVVCTYVEVHLPYSPPLFILLPSFPLFFNLLSRKSSPLGWQNHFLVSYVSDLLEANLVNGFSSFPPLNWPCVLCLFCHNIA